MSRLTEAIADIARKYKVSFETDRAGPRTYSYRFSKGIYYVKGSISRVADAPFIEGEVKVLAEVASWSRANRARMIVQRYQVGEMVEEEALPPYHFRSFREEWTTFCLHTPLVYRHPHPQAQVTFYDGAHPVAYAIAQRKAATVGWIEDAGVRKFTLYPASESLLANLKERVKEIKALPSPREIIEWFKRSGAEFQVMEFTEQEVNISLDSYPQNWEERFIDWVASWPTVTTPCYSDPTLSIIPPEYPSPLLLEDIGRIKWGAVPMRDDFQAVLYGQVGAVWKKVGEAVRWDFRGIWVRVRPVNATPKIMIKTDSKALLRKLGLVPSLYFTERGILMNPPSAPMEVDPEVLGRLPPSLIGEWNSTVSAIHTKPNHTTYLLYEDFSPDEVAWTTHDLGVHSEEGFKKLLKVMRKVAVMQDL